MGLLSSRGVPSWHPAPQELVLACRKASEFCLSEGYPIEKLAVQYAVSNPGITTTLFSSSRSCNVLRNIEWASSDPDWELVRKVRSIIGGQMRVSWSNS